MALEGAVFCLTIYNVHHSLNVCVWLYTMPDLIKPFWCYLFCIDHNGHQSKDRKTEASMERPWFVQCCKLYVGFCCYCRQVILKRNDKLFHFEGAHCLFFVLVFFLGGGGGGEVAFPSYISGVTTFGWDFCVCDRFFDPTIKVVTFCLRGWCVLGVFLLPAFTRLGHERQDLLSPCDEMHVCTD